jgi:hypothetical protein
VDLSPLMLVCFRSILSKVEKFKSPHCYQPISQNVRARSTIRATGANEEAQENRQRAGGAEESCDTSQYFLQGLDEKNSWCFQAKLDAEANETKEDPSAEKETDESNSAAPLVSESLVDLEPLEKRIVRYLSVQSELD